MEGWVTVIGSVGGLLTLVIGALGTWWLKIKQQDATTRQDDAKSKREELELQYKLKREDTEEARRQRKEDADEDEKKRDALIAEYQQLQATLRKDIEARGKALHDVRDMCHELSARLGLTDEQLRICQKRLAECDEERGELRRQLGACREALRRAGLWPFPTDVAPDAGGDARKGGAT